MAFYMAPTPPDFGAQNTTTTGSSTAGAFIPSGSSVPVNGVFLPSANTVAISAGTGDRFRVDSSGRTVVNGAATNNSVQFLIGGTVTSSGTVSRLFSAQSATVPSTSTAEISGYYTGISTQDGITAVTNISHYVADQGTVTGGTRVAPTAQHGFRVRSSLTGATSNYGFTSQIAAGAGRWNFYAEGTAENYFANNVKIGGTADRGTTAGTNQLCLFNGTAPVGTLTNGVSLYSASGTLRGMDAAGAVTTLGPNLASASSILSSGATAGVGYATGAGSAQVQGTSRTTTVVANNVCGSIQLFSAAGSTTWTSFTVTNSAVAATDTVIVVQRTGTDLYEIHVTAVAAGSFRISFRTTGGTTTETPIFNFAVIKAVAA